MLTHARTCTQTHTHTHIYIYSSYGLKIDGEQSSALVNSNQAVALSV